MKRLLLLMSSDEATDYYLQGRFDGAYRRKTKRSAIGVAIDLIIIAPVEESISVLLLARETSSRDSYCAEAEAAEALVQACVELYAKLLIACSPK